MSIPPGSYRLGPESATLAVHTGRGGAAAKAGHDLEIHVTAWEGTLDLAEDTAQTSVELAADATSLRVRKGQGGMQALGDEDVANIHQTIDDEVLRREDITFRSTRAEPSPDGGRITIAGDLAIVGKTQPIEFVLVLASDGSLSGSAVVKQTDWGMKPYSALFGALKVKDEVDVVLASHGPVA